ncbi:MAG TPA: PEP-utilizing enzyme [Solirubrobacterales bacterium]|nr:PEP-utilizing enzyme [Solirubrobacterales bacterium]
MTDERDEPTIRERVWFNWQQPASPLLLGGTIDACGQPFREFFGFPFFTSIIYYRTLDRDRGYQCSWLLRRGEGEACGRLLVDALSVPSFQAHLDQAIEASFGALGAAGVELSDLDLERLNDDELTARFEDFQRLFIDFYRIGAITEPVSWHVERFFREFADDAEGAAHLPRGWSSDRIEAAAFMTDEESYTLEIERSLVVVAELFDAANLQGAKGELVELASDWEAMQRRHPGLAAAASQHAESYPWKANNYRVAKAMGEAEVIAEIQAMDGAGSAQERLRSSIADTERRRASMSEDRARLLAGCPPTVRSALRIGDRYGSGLADRRKATMLPALQLIESIARELARRSGVDHGLILNLTPSEVGEFARSPEAYRERLERRREALVLVQAPFPLDNAEMAARLRIGAEGFRLPRKDDTSLAEGPEALVLLDRIDATMGLFRHGKGDEVSGSVIVWPQTGSILEGRCRVISDPRTDRLEPGEILIATSTTPDFMPAIRNASALLVDQGGTLSHAALTSRELGKPCIIGTAHASSVFRSGDLLRLDFDAGTAIAIAEPADGE